MRLPKHLINIIIVIVIIFITFHSWLNLNELPNRGDKDNPNISSTDLVPYNAVNAYITRDSILNKHDLTPLWNPFYLVEHLSLLNRKSQFIIHKQFF